LGRACPFVHGGGIVRCGAVGHIRCRLDRFVSAGASAWGRARDRALVFLRCSQALVFACWLLARWPGVDTEVPLGFRDAASSMLINYVMEFHRDAFARKKSCAQVERDSVVHRIIVEGETVWRCAAVPLHCHSLYTGAGQQVTFAAGAMVWRGHGGAPQCFRAAAF
jgi:hypothetical protein